MKRIFFAMLAVLMLLGMSGCGATKTVHCDGCGAELAVEAGSNMEDSWIIFCDNCDDELNAEIDDILNS